MLAGIRFVFCNLSRDTLWEEPRNGAGKGRLLPHVMSKATFVSQAGTSGSNLRLHDPQCPGCLLSGPLQKKCVAP